MALDRLSYSQTPNHHNQSEAETDDKPHTKNMKE